MIWHYILIMGAILLVACEIKDSIRPVEKRNYPHTCPQNSNPGLTPTEKPNIEGEYYEAPRLQ